MTQSTVDISIEMPQLGESVAEARITRILVGEGEKVNAEQAIMEVETSKAVMEITSLYDGTLSKILAQEQEDYSIGSSLAIITVDRDKIDADIGDIQKKSERKAHFETPQTESNSFFYNEESKSSNAKQNYSSQSKIPVPAVMAGASYLSPRMRARLDELGLNSADLSAISGSGKGGRVTIEDLENFLKSIERNRLAKASPMRIAVADSMRRSWSRPLATVAMPIILDKMLAHRRQQKSKPGPTLYALRALGIALSENPSGAGRLVGERIVQPAAINIGFAVEADDGVIVPVIENVEQKTLLELTPLYNKLVGNARKRKLQNANIGSGIATVTNFGAFGISMATPIPLPEQNLVLGFGAGRKMPVWDEENQNFIPKIEARLTLSFDHRLMDGGGGGRLLARVIELLNKPETL